MILVVEDNLEIAEIIELILKNNGFGVLTHSSGLGATEIVSLYKPDLVLLDIMLPGKSGTDICRELKEISDHPPIILFSANALESKIFIVCKADAFIKKPFDIADLIQTVNRLAA